MGYFSPFAYFFFLLMLKIWDFIHLGFVALERIMIQNVFWKKKIGRLWWSVLRWCISLFISFVRFLFDHIVMPFVKHCALFEQMCAFLCFFLKLNLMLEKFLACNELVEELEKEELACEGFLFRLALMFDCLVKGTFHMKRSLKVEYSTHTANFVENSTHTTNFSCKYDHAWDKIGKAMGVWVLVWLILTLGLGLFFILFHFTESSVTLWSFYLDSFYFGLNFFTILKFL